MKKITLLIVALAVTAFTTAQTVLSHSVDNTVFENGSVACLSDPDQVPGNGDEAISDNIYYRSYVPSEFGINGGFQIQGANFFISFNDLGGTNPTANFTVRFYTTDGVFPAGTLTEIASQAVEATEADNGTLFEVLLDTPVDISADEEIVVGVDIPASPAAPDNYDIRIGINSLGEDEPTYLSSVGCALLTPTPTAAIGFPDNAAILDLVGEEVVLGVNEAALAQISVYPNPVKDNLNLKVPASLEVKNVAVYDLLGKNLNVSFNDGVVNTASLSQGVYLLKVETSAGTLTQKVVKQ